MYSAATERRYAGRQVGNEEEQSDRDRISRNVFSGRLNNTVGNRQV